MFAPPKLLKDNNMLSHKKRKRVQTTDSDHCFYKYPNRAKNLVPKRSNMLWVADMSYIPLGSVFIYLSEIMDAYSRKIVGWHLDKTMEAKGSVCALEMALQARVKPAACWSIIPIAACNTAPGSMLSCLGIMVFTISMTQSGDPNENAMAERLFRTLKEDFGLRGFASFLSVQATIEKAVNHYNAVRPHASLGVPYS